MEEFSENYKKAAPELQQDIDKIVLRAAEMPLFQNLIKEATDKMNAITLVRQRLREYFPEIEKLPEVKPTELFKFQATNEFKIAKALVGLLWQKLP